MRINKTVGTAFIIIFINACSSDKRNPSSFVVSQPIPSALQAGTSQNEASPSSSPNLDLVKPLPVTSSTPSIIPSKVPVISVDNGNSHDFANGQGSVTFRLNITDYNQPTASQGCQPHFLEFYVETRGGLTRQLITEYQLEQFQQEPLVFTYEGLPVGQKVDLVVPGLYEKNGTRYMERIESVATTTQEGTIINLDIPARIWPVSKEYKGISGSVLTTVSQSPVNKDTPLVINEKFNKFWEVRNETNFAWTGLQLVNVEPKTNYINHSLKPVETSYPIPDTSPGSNVKLAFQFTTPRRSGWYQSSWMIREKATGHYQFSDFSFSLTVNVVGPEEAFTSKAKIQDDRYSLQPNLMIGEKNFIGILPVNYFVRTGVHFDVFYQLKNTGKVIWENRKLIFNKNEVQPEHLLKPDKEILNIPRTLPGETAKIGPVTYYVHSLNAHYGAWKMTDSEGHFSFEGEPEAITQVSVGPAPIFCGN